MDHGCVGYSMALTTVIHTIDHRITLYGIITTLAWLEWKSDHHYITEVCNSIQMIPHPHNL